MPTDVTVLQRHTSAWLAETPILAELQSYWVDKRAERSAPCRSDIDPIEIPSLLHHLLLLDVIEAGARFRYRLAGTEIERRIGCQVTVRHLDEATEGQHAAYIQGLYRQLLRLGPPSLLRVRIR